MSDAPDPWAIQRWAYAQKTGSPARKAVLQALATIADSETGRCEAKQSTLATWTEISERSVRTHLGTLEKAGFIARRRQSRVDGSRRNDEYLVLAPWVTEWPDGEALPENLARGESEQGEVRNVAAQERPPGNEGGGAARARELEPADPKMKRADDIANRRPLKLTYKRRRVPEEKAHMAVSLLGDFCRLAGHAVQAWKADGSPTPSLTTIIGAVLDYERSYAEWSGMQRAVLTNPNPWWDGVPGVGVVFGPKVVESNLADPQRSSSRRQQGGGGGGGGAETAEDRAMRRMREAEEEEAAGGGGEPES